MLAESQSELTPAELDSMRKYPEWWYLSGWSLDNPRFSDTGHNISVMWPFRCGQWIVATNVASVIWCKDDGTFPLTSEFLNRPLNLVREIITKVMQRSMAVDWGKAEKYAHYSHYLENFDADHVCRLQWLLNVRVAFGQMSAVNDLDPARRLGRCLYFKWGTTGGGCILSRE